MTMAVGLLAWCFYRVPIWAQNGVDVLLRKEFVLGIYLWLASGTCRHQRSGQKAPLPSKIEQIMFSMPTDIGEEEAERQLYLVRRRIEKAVIQDLIVISYAHYQPVRSFTRHVSG